MQTPATDLLLVARELVRRGWTRGAEARNATGAAVEPWDTDATAWSLLGALVAAYDHHAPPDEPPSLAPLAAGLTALACFVDDDCLAAWNDADGRTRLRPVLNAAAVRAEQDEATFAFEAN
jgi:hypothetical protein